MVIPPSPSPSPSSSLDGLAELLFLEAFLELITVSLISTLVLFCLISLFLIIHLHLKSRQSHSSLKNFNSLYYVRVLLVCFICLWGLSEFFRLPFTRSFFFTFFPSLTDAHQSNLCKIHVVLSLGLFEPGFLVTLLFLLSFSIKRKDPNDTFGSAVAVVIALCLPILALQVFFIFFPNKNYFPEVFWRSYVTVEGADYDGGGLVLCTYPLFGTIVFGTFAAVYIMYFLLTCCKVIALVINKGLRMRIYALGLSVLVAVPTQVVLLSLSIKYHPTLPAYYVSVLVIFLVVLLCATVGQGILVIKPIADALAVGREFRWWKSCHERLPVVQGDKEVALVQER